VTSVLGFASRLCALALRLGLARFRRRLAAFCDCKGLKSAGFRR
jgi:hypothetical protein